MFASGLIDEVQTLIARGYSPDLPPMKAIGYKQVVDLLDGKLTREKAIAETMKATRRFAKRQLTWYRAQPEVQWVAPGQRDEIFNSVRRFWDRDPA